MSQAATQRAHSKRQPAAAVFSRTAARLIEQIEADARAKLLEELSAKDAITVLHPLDQRTKRIDRVEADHISISDGRGARVNLWRRREEPASWRDCHWMAGKWHPARWEGSMVLLDSAGVEWRRDLPDMVCDDFGNLVEVPA